MIKTRTYARATKKEIADTFRFLDIASGKEKTPDFWGYTKAKQELDKQSLPPDEYECKIAVIAEKYGV